MNGDLAVVFMFTEESSDAISNMTQVFMKLKFISVLC